MTLLTAIQPPLLPDLQIINHIINLFSTVAGVIMIITVLLLLLPAPNHIHRKADYQLNSRQCGGGDAGLVDQR